MQNTTQEVLRAIRGARSQVAFARRLGYLGNPIADWEAGRRCPTAREMLRACQVVKIDVVASFARFHPAPILAKPDEFDIAAWLQLAKGSISTTELAKRSGHSRQRVARWLSGRTQPRVVDFFQLVQAITGRLCDLVAELVPIQDVPSLRDDYERRLMARHLAHEEPWTEAILRVMETEAYRRREGHKPGCIARTLGIAPAIESRCLDALSRAGIIKKSGKRYRVVSSLTVDTRAVPKLKAHWSDVATQRLGSAHDADTFCYNVLSASAADVQRIRELILATFRQIRSIVGATPRDEAVALVNLQLVTWPSAPATGVDENRRGDLNHR